MTGRLVVPQAAMQTFAIVKPRATHYRPATCAEVECAAHLNGWTTLLLAGSDDLDFVRTQVCGGAVDGRRRHFTEEPAPDGMVRLTFPAGQPCFAAAEHVVDVERDPVFLVRPGDGRSNPISPTGARYASPELDVALARRGGRIHTRPEHWVEHSAETLDRVRSVRERG